MEKVVDLEEHRTKLIQDMIEKNVHDILEQSGSSGFWAEEFKAFIDSQNLKSLFFSEDWVFILIDICANKISSQRLRVMKKEISDSGMEIIEPDFNHPLNSLLDAPNEFQDYHSYMYNVGVEYFLMGNSIVWRANSTKSLIPLSTDLVTLDFDKSGLVSSYVFHTANTSDVTGFIRQKNALKISPKDIIHCRRPNPNSLIWGLSPLIAARKSVLFNRYTTDYLNSFFLKQALPALALKIDKTLNEDQALRKLRKFEKAYTGRANQRRTLILPKGVDIESLTHSLSDQQIPILVEKNRETLMNIFKVPKHELSLQTAGSLGSEEHKTALRNFWESTLIPAMKIIEGCYNKFFKNELGENRFLQFDLSDVAALKEDLVQKAELAQKMSETLTINEVRERVWQAEPISSQEADLPLPLIKAKSQQQIQLPQQEQMSFSEFKKLPQVKAAQKATHSDVKTEERKMTARTLDLFSDFAASAIKVIKSTLVEKAAEIPSKRKLRKDIQKEFEKFKDGWVSDYENILKKAVKTGEESQLEFIINEQDRRQIEVLNAQTQDKKNALLRERGLFSFESITDTQTDRVMREISKGVEKKETILEIAQRITRIYGPAISLGKAQTIARTETLTASSIGQLASANSAKKVIPGLSKVWITANDEDVRTSHQSLDGVIVGVDEKFISGNGNQFMVPRDPKVDDPSDVINCRCTMALIPPGTRFSNFDFARGRS